MPTGYPLYDGLKKRLMNANYQDISRLKNLEVKTNEKKCIQTRHTVIPSQRTLFPIFSAQMWRVLASQK